ncbi:AzlD domain-containing protein [Paenibacillus spongiae]|uniref:AzlD domain-containing protein n=1 Tax=Paenibacillus spongiae TaxID=2909671 RepID=A0ABY5SKM0_9BACL|nr:AzlD domain-containing protein [Paenibacillus spongiae]UVI32788.1 AzlD domain-containing protein [Paenibacillus spongiae]
MEVRWDILVIIFGTAIVTFIPRVLPLMALSRIELPDWGLRWLKYVPISVMAALVGQELFTHNGDIASLASNLKLFAALPTLLVAVKTRSLLMTVITGIVSMMLLRLFF